jgi:hypothetical protein
LLEAVSYDKSIDSALGQRFDIEVDSGIRRISNHPQHFHLRSGGYRRINLRDFPYFIPFIIQKNQPQGSQEVLTHPTSKGKTFDPARLKPATTREDLNLAQAWK